jgi:hypothetical protein
MLQEYGAHSFIQLEIQKHNSKSLKSPVTCNHANVQNAWSFIIAILRSWWDIWMALALRPTSRVNNGLLAATSVRSYVRERSSLTGSPQGDRRGKSRRSEQFWSEAIISVNGRGVWCVDVLKSFQAHVSLRIMTIADSTDLRKTNIMKKNVPKPKHNTMKVCGTLSASFHKIELQVLGKHETNIR